MLRLLADQMPAIVWTTDLDLRFQSSFGGGLAALGLRADEVAGVSLFDYLRTTDPEMDAIVAHRRAAGGESAEYEMQWADRTYSTHVEPLRGLGGAIEGVIGLAFDVTDRERAKEGLERTLALLRATLDSTADGILVVDEAGKIVTYNARFVAMWGIPDTVVASRNDDQALAFVLDQLVDPGLFVTRTMDVYAHPRSETMDVLHFKDGRVFERYSPASRGLSSPNRTRVWSFRNITERVRAEEDRSRSLSLVEAALESTADGILVVDREGQIVRHNRKFGEMWRVPDSLFASADDAKLLAFVIHQLKNPDAFLRKVKDLYDHPESQSFDWLEFTDGRVFERYSQPQRVGGTIIGRVWSFRDVTDRARMEEILRRQARTFEHMFDAVIVTDVSGRIVDCNPAAEKMFGHSRETLVGKSPETLLSPAEDQQLTGKMLDAIQKVGRWVGQVRFRRKDGARGTSQTTVVPHSDEYGRTTAAIFIHRDITERKELERRLADLQGFDDTGIGRG
jgi:PAS domain S-box-containing protein